MINCFRKKVFIKISKLAGDYPAAIFITRREKK